MTPTEEPQASWADVPEFAVLDHDLRSLAATIMPRQAFLTAHEMQAQREASALAAARIAMTDEKAVASSRQGSSEEVGRQSETALWGSGRPVAWRAARNARTAGATPIPVHSADRRIGRRGFLIGSAAAVAGAAFVAFRNRNTTSFAVPVEERAYAAPVSAEMLVTAMSASTTTSAASQPSALDFSGGIAGWGLWGTDSQEYVIGVDSNVKRQGAPSGSLRSTAPDPAGFGTLARAFVPDSYRGKRVRMTGTVKADGVENWAGLWMRVDGPQQQTLSYDNMQGRPITGTRDWQTYTIVLDVPRQSALVSVGVLLVGKGQIWLSDVRFDVVGPDVPTTDTAGLPDQARNLDFEAKLAGWFLGGTQPQDYRIGIDTTVTHGGKASGYLQAIGGASKGFGTLMQMVQPGSYAGKRVRMSGWAKANGVGDWAGLWMRVDAPGKRGVGIDNMQNRPIKGTSDWARYEIVLDVPTTATAIAFGILLQGKGEVWFDDVQFAAVGPDVPTTNLEP